MSLIGILVASVALLAFGTWSVGSRTPAVTVDRGAVGTLAREGLERLNADRDIRAGAQRAKERSDALRLWTDGWEARVEAALVGDPNTLAFFRRDVTTKGMHWIEVPVHHLTGKVERLQSYRHGDIELRRAFAVDRPISVTILLPGRGPPVAKGPIYRFVLAEFVNVGTHDLRNVAAHVTFIHPDGTILTMIARNPEPEQANLDSFDLLTNGVPRACDVAFKEKADVNAYSYNTDNRREDPYWKWPPHELPPGEYRVTVQLRTGSVRESFGFVLTNPGAGNDLRFEPERI